MAALNTQYTEVHSHT